MAAWTAGLLVVSLVTNIGVLVWRWSEWRRANDAEVIRQLRSKVDRAAMAEQPGDQAMLDRVLDRLLAAVVPEPEVSRPAVTPDTYQGEGEYEEPDDARPVMDWTDPFIGLERPMVARLAPGEQIPGVGGRDDIDGGGVDPVEAWRESGQAAFDDWMRETRFPEGIEDMPLGSWVQPVDIGMEVDDERG